MSTHDVSERRRRPTFVSRITTGDSRHGTHAFARLARSLFGRSRVGAKETEVERGGEKQVVRGEQARSCQFRD